jgi:hypothetical protein
MRTSQNEIIKLQIRIFKPGIAALFGCFVCLLGVPLHGQDQLLKEYIYLDGRLLAVERQPTPAIAQQPATVEDKDLKAGLPADGDFLSLPAYMPETPFSHFQGSFVDSIALGQRPGAPASSPASAAE